MNNGTPCPQRGCTLQRKVVPYSNSPRRVVRGDAHPVEVTDDTTQAAAVRLVLAESRIDVVALNFASARRPGGGFVKGGGKKSQEEELARCTGLYPCLLTQPACYSANRRHDSLLYTDHAIFSRDVPWFRTQSAEPPNDLFCASIITAPAPNAGEVLLRDADAGPQIEHCLRHRAGVILAVARHQACKTIILGAWGCGVFRNCPSTVADAFGQWLESDKFRGIFDRVVFAVYDRSRSRSCLEAFRSRLVPR